MSDGSMINTGPSCPNGGCAPLSRHSVDLLQRRHSTRSRHWLQRQAAIETGLKLPSRSPLSGPVFRLRSLLECQFAINMPDRTAVRRQSPAKTTRYEYLRSTSLQTVDSHHAATPVNR